eukprot:9273321-Pyramimonas_sp.AAC.1
MGCAHVIQFIGQQRKGEERGARLEEDMGRERMAGEGRARGRTANAAAAEGRCRRAKDDDECDGRKPKSAAF